MESCGLGDLRVDAAQGSEAIGCECVAGIPEIVAGQIDVLPAERSDVGEQFVGHDLAASSQGVQGAAEIGVASRFVQNCTLPPVSAPACQLEGL